jgi:hypothetical protein
MSNSSQNSSEKSKTDARTKAEFLRIMSNLEGLTPKERTVLLEMAQAFDAELPQSWGAKNTFSRRFVQDLFNKLRRLCSEN